MRSVTLLLVMYTLTYFVACSFFASRVFNRLAGDAYMDEIFHVPQSQTYCQGRFNEWNNKITTFPGLYFTALGYVRAIAKGQQVWSGANGALTTSGGPADSASIIDTVCTLPILRSLNILYGTLCIPLFFLILRKLHPSLVDRPGALFAATVQLSLFPLFFFFHFLFYTDGASVFWTLAAYLAHLSRCRFMSSTLGFVSILMRQTNVVWIGFMLLTDIMDAWTRNDPDVFGEDRNIQSLTTGSSKTVADGEKEDKLATTRVLYHPTSWSSFPRTLVYFVFSSLRALPTLILHHFGMILLCIAFVLFFILNGNSIVVGDRTHHTLSLHFPQVLYFILFSVGCTLPNWFGVQKIKQALESMWRNKIITLLVLIAMGCGVHYFTSVHHTPPPQLAMDGHACMALTYAL
jgi:alpha-1,2-glucosyltransferase